MCRVCLNYTSVLNFIAGTVYICLCVVQLTTSLKGPLCLNCQNIPFPRDCNRIIQCEENEKCEASSFVTDSANTLFNVGCSSRCSAKRSPIRRKDITVCSQCCDGDYCNRYLCGYTPSIDMANRMYCLQCDDVIHPTQCENTVLCDTNEICYTEYIKRNGEYRYRMGCINPQSCSDLGDAATKSQGGKRFIINSEVRIDSYCNRCCKDKSGNSGNCNRKLCNDKEAVPANVEELILVKPPQRTDSCVDLTENSCKVIVIEDPTVCNVPGISHFACRQTCGTCVATVSSGGTLPATDCFYESRKYQGAYETTITGATCVDWSMVFYQESMAYMFPDATLRDAKNRCRDPDGRGHPWCFTSTNNDWDYCPVPFCDQCYFTGKSRLYNGYKNTDMYGYKCLPWTISPLNLPDSSFVDGSKQAAGNYCRNPFPENTVAANSSLDEPICFTNSGYRDCGVKRCTDVCKDSSSTNCSLVKNYVCQNDYMSTTLCPKTCGKCGFGLLPPVVISPPKGFCEDNPAANCKTLQNLICSDPDGARNLCPRTCQRCNELNLTPRTTQSSVTTLQSTQTTVAAGTTQIPLPHWLEWGPYQCQIKGGLCLMTRFRNCSSPTGCAGRNSLGVVLCTKEHCPYEINQINGNSITAASSEPSIAKSLSTIQSTVQTTSVPSTTTDSCGDSDRYNCDLVKDVACADDELKYFCNKTCHLCGCRDALQCQSATSANSFCSDKDLAQKYCKRTCNKCQLPDIPITYNRCGDPVSKDDGCNTLQREICLCSDPDLVQLCRNYCDRKCGPIATCLTTVGRRSVKNKFEIIANVLNGLSHK